MMQAKIICPHCGEEFIIEMSDENENSLAIFFKEKSRVEVPKTELSEKFGIELGDC